jgi:hypothetical protein
MGNTWTPRYRRHLEPQKARNRKKRTSSHCTPIKMSRVYNDRLLKASGKKNQLTYKGNSITVSADFSKETLKARRSWNDTLQV